MLPSVQRFSALNASKIWRCTNLRIMIMNEKHYSAYLPITKHTAHMNNVKRWNSSASSSVATVGLSSASTAKDQVIFVEPTTNVVISTPVEEAAQKVETLADLGLGGWSPSGILQTVLDFLHTSTGLPWWAVIVLSTITARTCLLPLMVKAQVNAANMNNNMPEMQRLQAKMTEARNSGNKFEAARIANDLVVFMKEKDINIMKSMLTPMVQAPIFISFFFALRGMANVPIESFKAEGMMWFTDLTIPDPFYALPLITSATLLATIELGAEGGVKANNMPLARYVLRAFPLIAFPFMINFPSAILCYWCTSNFFALGTVALLKIPVVRERLGIPKLIHHKKDALTLSKRGFVESFKETFTNTKIAQQVGDRMRADEIRFKQAGMAPLVKTYPYDPTKQQVTTAKRKTS